MATIGVPLRLVFRPRRLALGLGALVVGALLIGTGADAAAVPWCG